jgi:hypothetical protein
MRVPPRKEFIAVQANGGVWLGAFLVAVLVLVVPVGF